MRMLLTASGSPPLGLRHAAWLLAVLGGSLQFPLIGASQTPLPVPSSSAPRGGFSRPGHQATSETLPPSALIREIRLSGASVANPAELLDGLACRPGQPPSRTALELDLERLRGLELFGAVNPQWESTPQGWILTLELMAAAPPLVVRGQSDHVSAAGSLPPPAGGSRLIGKAPRLPRDAEDMENSRVEQASFSLEDPLVDVRIEGNVTIPVSEIQKHVKTRPGRVATQTSIREDVDALVRTRWFVSVEPVVSRNSEGLVLTYRVLERPIVRNVEYRGANKVKREKLEALTNLKVGSPYDVSANRECARRIEELYHEKGFAFATVELEKGNHPDDREVIFVIDEGPKVQVVHVEFEGNSFFSDSLLDLKLQTKKRILWSFGGKYDPATIPNDKASITRYYRGLGFFDMAIEHDLRFNEDRSKVTIVYNIDEGARYKIRDVEIIGADVIPEEELRRDHKIVSGEFFSERKLSTDVEKMREKYGSLGRLFAKVDAVPRFTEEPGVVDILYKIDEDKVYRVREFNVHIAGDHPHSRTNLVRNMSLIQPGDLADPRKIQRTKTRIGGSGVFEGQGELAPRLEISRVEDPGWLQITAPELARGQTTAGFTPPGTNVLASRPATGDRPAAAPPSTVVSEVPRVMAPPQPQPAPAMTRPVLGSEAKTNDVTPLILPYGLDEASAPEAEFGTPEPVNGPLVRGQNEMLMAQGRGPFPEPQRYIYDVNPDGDPLVPGVHDPGPLWDPRIPPPEFIDIDAYVAEARTGRLMFGAGVNSNSGVVGNIVLSENNFDITRVPTSWNDVWNGTAFRGAGQKFRIEALPGSEVSRYLVDWQDPYFMDSPYSLGVSGFYFTRFYRDWNEQRVGGRVRMGRQFSQTWSGSVALRAEQVHISNIPSNSPPQLTSVLGDNFLSSAQFSLIHDTRDAAFAPSEGHYLDFSIEQAFGEFTYSRFEIDGRQYFTTYQRPDGGGKHIVNLHGNFGWTSSGTPIFENFYAGGFQSFRGFAFRGVSPQVNGVEVGGEFLLLGSVEYQVPVLANEMVKVVAFSDFGTVDEDVTLDNFRLAVGGGLRIQVPGMGPVPIALDWAVPVLKTDFDREQLFSFYVGINR